MANDYVTQSLLHEGDTCRVFRVFRVSDQRPVVLKTGVPAKSLQRELALLRQLGPGEHWVSALEVAETPEGLALVLLDDSAHTLHDIQRLSALSLCQQVRAALGIAQALVALHAHRVLHLDIKPSNILHDLVTNRTRLLDFGAAHLLPQGEWELSHQGEPVGTLAYMSAEQTGRTQAPIDFRADLYSLGITMFELFAGRLPYDSADPMTLVANHLSGEVPCVLDHAPTVPPVLSQIVAKAMAKAPNERYQTAHGLAADLQRCVRHLERGECLADVQAFRVGLEDPPQLKFDPGVGEWQVVQADVLDCCERGLAGQPCLAVVHGPEAKDTHALVDAALARVPQGATVCVASCQNVHASPLQWLKLVLRKLVSRQLGLDEEALREVRQRLTQALGGLAEVVVDLEPEFSVLLGEQAPPPTLEQEETRARRTLALVRTLTALGGAGGCVLVVQEGEALDEASIRQLLDLIDTPELRLVVVFMGVKCPADLQSRAGTCYSLDGLSLDGTRELLHQTLGALGEAEAAFAALVHQRTAGYLGAVKVLLKTLMVDQALRYSGGAFEVNLDAAAKVEFSLNTLKSLTRRLMELGEPRRRQVLTLAIAERPCQPRELAVWLGLDEAEVVADLDGLRQQGLLRFHHGAYRLTHGSAGEPIVERASLAQRRWIHTQIANFLIEQSHREPDAVDRFALLRHIAHGEPPSAPARRRFLAGQALQAAQVAMASTAYGQGLAFCDQGLALLDTHSSADLCFELRFCRGAALAGLGNIAKAEAELRSLMQQVDQQPGRVAQIARLLSAALAGAGREREAVQSSLAALRQLGADIPSRPGKLRPLPLVLWNQRRLTSLGDRLFELPECRDEKARAILKIIESMAGSAYQHDPNLFLQCVEFGLATMLDHGRAEEAMYLLGCHSLVVNGALKQPRQAYRQVQRTVRMTERYYSRHTLAKNAITLRFFTAPYFVDTDTSVEQLREARRINLERGELLEASYDSMAEIALRAYAGQPLAEQARVTRDLASIAIQTGQSEYGRYFGYAADVFDLLISGADAATRRTELVRQADVRQSSIASILAVAQVLPLVLLGDWSVVGPWLDALKVDFYQRMLAHSTGRDVELCWGLFAVQRNDAAELKRQLKRVSAMQKSTAGRFLVHERLLEAEWHRLCGRPTKALQAYHVAIGAAEEEERLHLLALAEERAADLLLVQGRSQQARLHNLRAREAYAKFGLVAKVRSLSGVTWGDSSHLGRTPAATTRRGPASLALRSTQSFSEQLDLATVLDVSRRISQELESHGVIRAVLTGIGENAGADRALLVIHRPHGLCVCAELTQGEVSAFETPLEAYADAPAAMLRKAYRTGKSEVLGGVQSQVQGLVDHAYYRRSGVRSLAAVPVRLKGTTIGVLLLCNHVLDSVFHAERMKLVEALASQASVSLENAALYEDMEERIATRTEALRLRNAEMRLVFDNVDQGLVIVSQDGELSRERSQIIDTWFSGHPPHRLRAFFADDQEHMEAFELGFEQVFDGLLPVDLCLEQLPRETRLNTRVLSLAYRPLRSTGGSTEDSPHALLVVITDVTEARKRAQAELRQHQLLTLLRRLSQDRASTLDFLREAQELVQALAGASPISLEVERRLLHTLKGNCGIFGLQQFASLCHDLESRSLTQQRSLSTEERQELVGAFDELQRSVTELGSFQNPSPAHVDPEAYERALALLQQEGHPLAPVLHAWQLQPVVDRLRRAASQAEQLATRCGKAPVQVEIHDDGSRLHHARWPDFWAAFVHVIRNAVDHGLEPPEERRRGGKGPSRVTLSCGIRHGRFCVTFADDGRGIAWDRIRSKAQAAGLSAQSHQDLVAALFVDGISSRDSASELSGRGVGMSALADACYAMGGRISIDSEAGRGARLTFDFPPEVVQHVEDTMPPAVRPATNASSL